MDELVLKNTHGHTVSLTLVGAAMTSIVVPDRTGSCANIVVDAGGSAGKIIGRYANRIAGGSFELDGTVYKLGTNEGRNTLHGGPDGFSKRTWDVVEHTGARVTFVLHSPDGDQGFPGALECRVTYSWSDANALRIDYAATTDKPTLVNFTNHVYFNLSGVVGTAIEHYRLRIPASAYTPTNAENIPTGAIAPIDAARDFRSERPVGTEKYDCNFVLDAWDGSLRRAATLSDPDSARTIGVETTQPGMQLFTGKPGAIALETQHFADSPHHPNFPSTVLRPGETFTATTVYSFSS
ncbi:MAG: aldose epimerase family protein [Vulcanimicrobiaceae bacterium]